MWNSEIKNVKIKAVWKFWGDSLRESVLVDIFSDELMFRCFVYITHSETWNDACVVLIWDRVDFEVSWKTGFKKWVLNLRVLEFMFV